VFDSDPARVDEQEVGRSRKASLDEDAA